MTLNDLEPSLVLSRVHRTESYIVCCPLLNYIRTILDNLYRSGCSTYLV